MLMPAAAVGLLGLLTFALAAMLIRSAMAERKVDGQVPSTALTILKWVGAVLLLTLALGAWACAGLLFTFTGNMH